MQYYKIILLFSYEAKLQDYAHCFHTELLLPHFTKQIVFHLNIQAGKGYTRSCA
jgi:hypothetical protein